MSEQLLNSPLLYSIALTLIHFLWQGVLVALALKISLIITPLKNSRVRYGLSSLAMLSNLLLPFITFFIIYQSEYLQLNPNLQGIPLLTQDLVFNSNSSNYWYSQGLEFLPYLSISWLVVTTALASKLLIELYGVNQLAKSHTLAPEKLMVKRFEQLINQLELTQTPRLLISLKTNIPMAIGWLKPVVLIPASMVTGLSPMQLDMLMLHELAHIRRNDYLVNFIQTLVETILFFHPAVHWVSKQMRNEREYCSDDIAVKHCGDPIAYAHTLADTASLCRKHRHQTIPNMAMAASGGDLKQRVLRLVDHHHCSANKHSGKWLASALIVLSVVTMTSKQLMSLPVIDITTGSISLYKESNDNLILIPKDNIKDLSTTTIAKQLLSKNNIELTPVIKTTPSNKAEIASNLEVFSENSDVINNLSVNETETNIFVDTALVETVPVSNDENKINTIAPAASVNPVSIVKTSSQPQTKNTPQAKATSVITEVELIEDTSFNDEEKPLLSLVSSQKNVSNISNNKSILPKPYVDKKSLLKEEPVIISSNTLPVVPLSVNEFEDESITLPIKEKAAVIIEEAEINNEIATLISSIEPTYPSTAKRKGVELDVMVTFIIDTDGLVKEIEFESKNKVGYFRTTIRSAMEKWRFLPANVNGQPVESVMSKIFSFSLMA